MVKEQRGRLTELSRGRQEIVGDYKVCLNWNKLLHNSILRQDIVFKTIVVCNDMDQHEKQSSSTRAIRLWHLSCLFSCIAAHHSLIVVLIFGGISTTPINIMELRNESLPLGGNLIPRGSHNIWRIIFRYSISSNDSRSSINRIPRIIAPPLSPSSLLFISSLSSWSGIWSSKTDQWRFKLWKLIKEPNLIQLKKPKFSLFDAIIFWFNGILKQNL